MGGGFFGVGVSGIRHRGCDDGRGTGGDNVVQKLLTARLGGGFLLRPVRLLVSVFLGTESIILVRTRSWDSALGQAGWLSRLQKKSVLKKQRKIRPRRSRLKTSRCQVKPCVCDCRLPRVPHQPGRVAISRAIASYPPQTTSHRQQ